MHTKLHAVADANALPLGLFMTAGQVSNYKVLKAVAIIAVAVAVAYLAPQLTPFLTNALGATAATAVVSAIVSTAVSAAIMTELSLLAGKPTTNAEFSVFRQAISNSFIIYGKRRVGGLLIFFHPLGKTHHYFVIAVAGHQCRGVVHWWLNDEEGTVRADGLVLSAKYANNR